MLRFLARQAVDPLASLGELGILVPFDPVFLGTPRTHDHAKVSLALGLEKLSPDPPGLRPRRGEPLAHDAVPLLLRAFLEPYGGHDGHHGRSSLGSGSHT